MKYIFVFIIPFILFVIYFYSDDDKIFLPDKEAAKKLDEAIELCLIRFNVMKSVLSNMYNERYSFKNDNNGYIFIDLIREFNISKDRCISSQSNIKEILNNYKFTREMEYKFDKASSKIDLYYDYNRKFSYELTNYINVKILNSSDFNTFFYLSGHRELAELLTAFLKAENQRKI
nr:hypothetical protein GTC16762_32980 [Pigmentibacter ruber]